jgi:hypothetical protein
MATFSVWGGLLIAIALSVLNEVGRLPVSCSQRRAGAGGRARRAWPFLAWEHPAAGGREPQASKSNRPNLIKVAPPPTPPAVAKADRPGDANLPAPGTPASRLSPGGPGMGGPAKDMGWDPNAKDDEPVTLPTGPSIFD